MIVLVTGANGQLGSELNKISKIKNNFTWVFSDRYSFDISNLDYINFYLDNQKPDIIINCAAFTCVNTAEFSYNISDIINHKAVALIAKWCNKTNCKFIHISTDYVYSGQSTIPYTETDKTEPINNYGKTKLLGELACHKNNPNCIILRTSWLYSSFGNNFLKKMINAMKCSNEIKVVNDQIGSPTYAGDLAEVILQLIINNKWIPGIYNYTNAGNISWYDFANEIKSICCFTTIIKPISSERYHQKAKRPKYSILDNSKITSTFNIKQIGYLDSLQKCVKILQNES